MLKAACLIARKDLRLVLSRGAGLVQALLLGLLLIFVFSLSRETGETMSGQGAATIFWLSSAFCQVLSFNMLYGLEEANGSRAGLLLLPTPVQSVLLGKAAAVTTDGNMTILRKGIIGIATVICMFLLFSAEPFFVCPLF